MQGPLLRILVVALVLLAAAMLAIRHASPPSEPRAAAVPWAETENATVLPAGRPLPEFTLTDVEGRPFTKSSLEGRFTLLFFGFTNCPDVCPITMQVLASVAERLREEAPDEVPDVVFVSVDPFRDTPERIAAYVAAFDPSFIGVTGPDERLEPLVDALGVGVEKHEHHGEQYNVVHSGAIYVVGPRAEWIAVSTGPHVPATVASDFLKIRAAYLRRPPELETSLAASAD
ncbi:MAG TPA: SCO family protein [Gammaproteobacteria bacterium]